MDSVLENLLILGVGFLLSGVVGTFLVNRWQHGRWVIQRRIQKAEKDLSELRLLVSKITRLADKRNYRARKLCRSFQRVEEDELKRLRYEYEASVTEWNDEWTYFTVSLTLFAGYSSFIPRLEREIQERFVLVGSGLLYLLRASDRNEAARHRKSIENLLNDVSGAMFNFSRDLQSLIQAKENEAYRGNAAPLTKETLEEASTLVLLKALFKPVEAS